MEAANQVPGGADALEKQVQWLVDRAEITDLIYTLARCIDTKDWTGYAQQFTADAALVMPWEGEGAGVVGNENMARFASDALSRFHQTHHMMTNPQIAIDGVVAKSTHYLHSAHVRSAEDPQDHWDVGGWYHCEYTRTPDGWKFTRVALELVWLSGGAGDLDGDSW